MFITAPNYLFGGAGGGDISGNASGGGGGVGPIGPTGNPGPASGKVFYLDPTTTDPIATS
jgi:hypothetical protein